MLRNFVLVVAMSVFIVGCGAKEPKGLDNSSALRPNVSVLEERYSFVPKDEYLSSFNWTYQINAKKEGEYLLKNEQMVKTFLLAHNASKIIIVGKRELIREYYQYFKANQVQTPIILQDIEPVNADLNEVNILFFNQTKKGKKVAKKPQIQPQEQRQRMPLPYSPCNEVQEIKQIQNDGFIIEQRENTCNQGVNQ